MAGYPASHGRSFKRSLAQDQRTTANKKRTDTYDYSVCCVFCFVISFYCFVVLLLKPTRIAKETVRRQRQPSVDCQPRYATRTAKEIVRRQRQPSADCQPHYATRTGRRRRRSMNKTFCVLFFVFFCFVCVSAYCLTIHRGVAGRPDGHGGP